MKETLEQLEKKLEYCIREELYEKAAQIRRQISESGQGQKGKAPVAGFAVKKNKRFIDFINEKKTKP